jgi:hypothetical protein
MSMLLRRKRATMTHSWTLRVILPTLLGALVGLLMWVWVSLAPLNLILLVVFLLIWVWVCISAWTYQPVPEENPARIRIVQMETTFLALGMVFLFVPPWIAVVFFNGVVSFALGALILIIVIPCLFGVGVMIWRDDHLRREEGSQR